MSAAQLEARLSELDAKMARLDASDAERAVRRILELQARLADAHRAIGGKDWEIADLRRRLASAEEAVTELRSMVYRAHSDDREDFAREWARGAKGEAAE